MDRNAQIFRKNPYSNQFNPVVPRPSVDFTVSVSAIASQPRAMSRSSATLSHLRPTSDESHEFDRQFDYGRERRPSELDGGVIRGRQNSEYYAQRHSSSHVGSHGYNISTTGAHPRFLGPETPVLSPPTARPSSGYRRLFEASLEDDHRPAALDSSRSRNNSMASFATDDSFFDFDKNELETQYRNAPEKEEYEEEEPYYEYHNSISNNEEDEAEAEDDEDEDEDDKQNEEPPSTPYSTRHRRPSSGSVSSQCSSRAHSRASTPRAHPPAYAPQLAGIKEGSVGSVSAARGASFYAPQYPSGQSGPPDLKASPSSDRILTRAMEKALREGTWDGRGPFCSPSGSPSRSVRTMPYGRVASQKDAVSASSASPSSRRR